MIYLAITHIDADTGIVCTAEPMRTGPSLPQIAGWNIYWDNRSTWPVPTTPEGAYTVAPLFFGTCDDDADLTVSGVMATYTAEEYQILKNAEHHARKPFPSCCSAESRWYSWHVTKGSFLNPGTPEKRCTRLAG
jgi:hypothetical protein